VHEQAPNPSKSRKLTNRYRLRFGQGIGLGEGDRGFEITPYDPNFDKVIETAREFMRKYPNAMKKFTQWLRNSAK
jgi:hypothetical protein